MSCGSKNTNLLNINACTPATSTNRYGTKKIVRSYEVDNRKSRAVFYEDGGCDLLAKGYVPSTHNLTSNGNAQLGCQFGVNPAPESEGMDCLNFIFNKKHPRA
jgi:hypothetical protein